MDKDTITRTFPFYGWRGESEGRIIARATRLCWRGSAVVLPR